MVQVNSIFESILQSNVDQCQIQLILASLLNDDIPAFQRVNITTNVANDFKAIVENVIQKRKRDFDNENLLLKEYDPQTKPDSHEIEFLSISDHESIRMQIESLVDPTSLELFENDYEFVSNLRFYVITIIPPHGNPVYFFRTYTPKKELSRSKSFALVFRSGQYDRFQDSLFMFDQYIDCVACGDHIFIFGKDRFQKIFRFYELLRQSARETLDTIREIIPIDDFESFEEACEGHLQKLAKIKNISTKPYLQNLTMRDIKKVIQKYNLSIETIGRGSNEKIKYDASDKWAILRLLDDDYLESVMTGNSYEVNSKRNLKKGD